MRKDGDGMDGPGCHIVDANSDNEVSEARCHSAFGQNGRIREMLPRRAAWTDLESIGGDGARPSRRRQVQVVYHRTHRLLRRSYSRNPRSFFDPWQNQLELEKCSAGIRICRFKSEYLVKIESSIFSTLRRPGGLLVVDLVKT